jgi:hypothetical protein
MKLTLNNDDLKKALEYWLNEVYLAEGDAKVQHVQSEVDGADINVDVYLK